MMASPSVILFHTILSTMKPMEKVEMMEAMTTLAGIVGLNFEGGTDNAGIIALRFRQMKNFHFALMISQAPMMLMGDEYGHDTALNNFQWQQLTTRKSDHFRFFSEVIHYQRKRQIFCHENFLTKSDVTWHEDNWDNPDSKFLAFTLHDKNGGDIYLAFNAHEFFVKVSIPPALRRSWFRVVDTNLVSPDDFVGEGVRGIGGTYNVAPYSSILLEAK